MDSASLSIYCGNNLRFPCSVSPCCRGFVCLGIFFGRCSGSRRRSRWHVGDKKRRGDFNVILI